MFGHGGSGICGVARKKRQSNKKVKKSNKPEKTLPALAFVFPYHEMLMRDLLKVDRTYSVKTRKTNWNYRGPVLLYTSKGKHHHIPASAYNLDPKSFPAGSIVGVASIVNSRSLSRNEEIRMLKNFNNCDSKTALDMALGEYPRDYVAPLPFGLFLDNIKRFRNPVSFKPKRGAIGIMRVPIKKVSKALKEVGINI